MSTSTTDLAIELFDAALAAHAQGDLAGAEAYCAQSLAAFQRSEGEQSPNAASALNFLALIRQARGEDGAALAAAQQAVAILDALGADFTGADAVDLRVQA